MGHVSLSSLSLYAPASRMRLARPLINMRTKLSKKKSFISSRQPHLGSNRDWYIMLFVYLARSEQEIGSILMVVVTGNSFDRLRLHLLVHFFTPKTFLFVGDTFIWFRNFAGRDFFFLIFYCGPRRMWRDYWVPRSRHAPRTPVHARKGPDLGCLATNNSESPQICL